jgi:hypothetical protein
VDIENFGASFADKDGDLAIRSEGGSGQVAAEISFMSLPKMIAGANCHRATRRALDHPHLVHQLSEVYV